MFNFDASIPAWFALFVYAVLHNEATEDCWTTLLMTYRHNPKTVMLWIESIYETNDHEFTPDERHWWLTQLTPAEEQN